MASFIFEEGTQIDASGFTTGDTLIFKSATPETLGVVFTPATGLSVATVALTSGAETLTFSADALHDPSSSTTFLTSDGILSLGSAGNDVVSLTIDGDSAFYGFNGDDRFSLAGAGHFHVDGGSGNDDIDAYDTTGGNYLYGGAGSDTILAGHGNDHIYGNSQTSIQGVLDGDDKIYTNFGNNYVNGNGGDDSINAYNGSNRVYGGAGNDTIYAGAGNNTVNGNTGNDFIEVYRGNNFARGGQGDDTVQSNNGNNVIMGDAGNDILHHVLAGTPGVTVMTGGTGNDTFEFDQGVALYKYSGTAAGFNDEITDFTHGDDHIALSIGVTADNLIYAQSGVSFSNVDAAETYAQGLLSANSGTAQIASLQVGSDTYLFFDDGSNNSGTITSAIKLDGVTAGNVVASDFHAALVNNNG